MKPGGKRSWHFVLTSNLLCAYTPGMDSHRRRGYSAPGDEPERQIAVKGI